VTHLPTLKPERGFFPPFCRDGQGLFVLVMARVNQHPAVHHGRRMASGQETIFYWVLVVKLTTVVSSVAY